MRYKICYVTLIGLLLVGCGQSTPVIQPITQSISGTILLPSKKPLSNQRIVLIPVEIHGPIRSIVTNTNNDGMFTITEPEQVVYPVSYKIYVIPKSPKHKKLLPSKYYDREDDESDLVIDMNTVNGNITLKMNDK